MIKIAAPIILLLFLLNGCRQSIQEPEEETFGKKITIGNNKSDLISISENLGGYFVTTNDGHIFFGEMDGDSFRLKRTFVFKGSILYFAQAKIEATDTILWIGFRNAGFQKWRANGTLSLLQTYKIREKKDKYSPYHFLEKADGQFIIETSNGLYTSLESNDTLQLIYPGKPIMLSRENTGYEFRVCNVVKWKQHYFVSMENGLLKVDETGNDTIRVLSIATKYVTIQNDTLYALVPYGYNEKVIHSGNVVVKPIPAGGDAIALHVEGCKRYIFYPNSIVLIENEKKQEIPSALNKFSKHSALHSQTGETYFLQGDHLLERSNNNINGSKIKLNAVAIDLQKSKTFFWGEDKKLYVSKKTGELSLLFKMKSPRGEGYFRTCIYYDDNLFLISTNKVYKLWILWVPFAKPYPILELAPNDVINSVAQIKNYLYLGTRTGIVILDLENGKPKTIESQKYFESITRMNDDTLLAKTLNGYFYFIPQKGMFAMDKKQSTSLQNHPSAVYCNGWFDVINNSIKRFSDSDSIWRTVVPGVPDLNIKAAKTDNKNLIYFPAKDGGCAVLNVDTGAFTWMKKEDYNLQKKLAAGLGILLIVIIIAIYTLRRKKEIQNKGKQIHKYSKQQQPAESEEHKDLKLFITDKLKLLDEPITNIEQLKMTPVSKKMKAEFEKINEKITKELCELDQSILTHQLIELEKLSTQFDALKGLFLIGKQIEQSKILTTIRTDFDLKRKDKDINKLVEHNFDESIDKIKDTLTKQDRILLHEIVSLKRKNDKFRLLVLFLSTIEIPRVQMKELAAALETDATDMEKSPDTIKNRKQDLKKIMQNFENNFESVILQHRIKKLQEKWRKGNNCYL